MIPPYRFLPWQIRSAGSPASILTQARREGKDQKNEIQRWGRPIAAFRKRDEKEKRKRWERGEDSPCDPPGREGSGPPAALPAGTSVLVKFISQCRGRCQCQIVKSLALIFCRIVHSAAKPGKGWEIRRFPRERRTFFGENRHPASCPPAGNMVAWSHRKTISFQEDPLWTLFCSLIWTAP